MFDFNFLLKSRVPVCFVECLSFSLITRKTKIFEFGWILNEGEQLIIFKNTENSTVFTLLQYVPNAFS